MWTEGGPSLLSGKVPEPQGAWVTEPAWQSCIRVKLERVLRVKTSASTSTPTPRHCTHMEGLLGVSEEGGCQSEVTRL